MTWVLVFYVSIGIMQGATGGPATIDGFTTEAKCKAAGEKLAKRLDSKYDFGFCMQVEK